ncbi:MAG TPA: helix-hairpin-helix domain-containing protein [Gammaproteobacteria bacterium]|nr:helix-hairpin-helix domain-containing protein [Gammaproteobacteria bacterium]
MRNLCACVGLCLALVLAAPAIAAEPVNLNQASAEELTGLNGIGDVLAQRIIDYRDANGGFESVDQLAEVKGIGAKTLAELEDRVSIGH